MLALLIGGALMAVVTWVAVGLRAGKLEAAAKPATLLLLIAWFCARLVEVGAFPGAVFLLGLVASLTGDVLLLRPRRRLMAGMGAFLAAQLAYSAALNVEGPVLGWWSLGIAAGVVALAVAGFASLSRRARWHKRRGLKAATVVYAASLALLLWSAATATLRPGWPPLASGLVLGGAVLFCLSDTVLGWIEFVRPSRKGLVFVMVTYHLAQFALALGYSLALEGLGQ